VESARLRRMHIPARAALIGMSVREADRSLCLDGGGHGLLDTTHFDTVRFPPPDWAGPVVAEAITDGELAYTPYRGNPTVLADLAGSVGAFLGVPLGQGHLAITPGTQAALFTTLSALVDEGELVLVADPEYLFVERMLAFLGATVERVPVVTAPGSSALDLDAVEQALPRKPRLLLLSHPSNPTGAVYDAAMLSRLAQLAVRGDFLVVVDQLYSRLVYDGAAFTHLLARPGMAERCVTMLQDRRPEHYRAVVDQSYSALPVPFIADPHPGRGELRSITAHPDKGAQPSSRDGRADSPAI
jgi:aspartate/methionine/tyrosine aminotransferase